MAAGSPIHEMRQCPVRRFQLISHKADINRRHCDVRLVPILLQKSKIERL